MIERHIYAPRFPGSSKTAHEISQHRHNFYLNLIITYIIKHLPGRVTIILYNMFKAQFSSSIPKPPQTNSNNRAYASDNLSHLTTNT
eukprot:UN12707